MKDMVYERIKILLNEKYLRVVSNSMVKSLLTLDDECIQICLMDRRTCHFHPSKFVWIFTLVLKDL
jgi:hypothetical protein